MSFITASTAPAALRATTTPCHILFGSDHPYLDETLCRNEIEALAAYGR